MIKPTDKTELARAKKKRGHYFWTTISKPYSIKYGIRPFIIDELRGFAIHRKMSQADICIYITKNLNNGVYDKAKMKRSIKEKRISIKDVRAIREQLLTFCLRLKPEEFDEITHRTKWDWD